MDYVSMVALPEELRKKTVWVRINLNEAPLTPNVAYTWLTDAIIRDLRQQNPGQDFDDVAVLEKILAPELNVLRKGPLSHWTCIHNTRSYRAPILIVRWNVGTLKGQG